MNIEQIIANAPEGAERYWIWEYGDISYYKQSESDQKWSKLFSPFKAMFLSDWRPWAAYWEEATPLPKPAYSAENPPPDGWVGESKFLTSAWRETFIREGKIHLVQMGIDISSEHQFRETPTPRERFIEQAQAEGADFGAIYDEFVGGDV